jgi:hypothetical protein
VIEANALVAWSASPILIAMDVTPRHRQKVLHPLSQVLQLIVLVSALEEAMVEASAAVEAHPHLAIMAMLDKSTRLVLYAQIMSYMHPEPSPSMESRSLVGVFRICSTMKMCNLDQTIVSPSRRCMRKHAVITGATCVRLPTERY